MRSALIWSLFLVACGRPLVTTPSGEPEPFSPPRVRLTSKTTQSDGFRFSDAAILRTGRFQEEGVWSSDVRLEDGTVVEGDAARVDLEVVAGRFFALSIRDGQLCSTGSAGSLAEVDERQCGDWRVGYTLHEAFNSQASASNLGFIVRTTQDEAYRLWVVQSGFEASTLQHSVIFESGERPPLAECTSGSGCAVSADCCNRRHTCTSGVCQY